MVYLLSAIRFIAAQLANSPQVRLLPFRPIPIFLAIKAEEKSCFKDGFQRALTQPTSASNNPPPRAPGISSLSITSSSEQKAPMTRAYTLPPLIALRLPTSQGRQRRKDWPEKLRVHPLQLPMFVRSVVRLRKMMAKMRRTNTAESAVRLAHFNLYLEGQQTSILLQPDVPQLAKPPSQEPQLIRQSFLHSWHPPSTQEPPLKSERQGLGNQPQQTCPL